MEQSVKYRYSLHDSRFLGYQAKSGASGTVTLYITSIWKYTRDVDEFIDQLNFILVLERICLQRGLEGIRMRGRCKEIDVEHEGRKYTFPCVMSYIAALMVDGW